MPCLLTTGCILKCSFGQVPTPLNVLNPNIVANMMPVATMMDHIPIVNIVPFGMCNNPANPMVAAATIAALGILTPMPCIPMTMAPWLNPSNKLMVQGKKAIHESSKLQCMYGGQITVVSAIAKNIMIT